MLIGGHIEPIIEFIRPFLPFSSFYTLVRPPEYSGKNSLSLEDCTVTHSSNTSTTAVSAKIGLCSRVSLAKRRQIFHAKSTRFAYRHSKIRLYGIRLRNVDFGHAILRSFAKNFVVVMTKSQI